MNFTKMHGIGNDYVYVDCITNPPPPDPAKIAQKISDRHFGVGSDGLILICPSEKADVRMRMFNADGSEAEMCGNGIRCVAKYVYDHSLVRKPRLTIETGRGVLVLDLEIQNGKTERVTVDMGQPIMEAEKIPTTLSGPRVIDRLFMTDSIIGPLGNMEKLQFQITCVSMGNPHCVIFAERVATRAELKCLGPHLETHPAFPKRINVHLVQVLDTNAVVMFTWERGSGMTQACGTGACAVCVAGVLTGKTARRIRARLPGGELELHWNEADDHVYMTGPAAEVFSGEWPE